MTNWTNPTLAQTWPNRDSAIKGRDESNAKMDYSNDTNFPDKTIRWSASNNRFEIWSTATSTWSELSSTYDISATRLNGKLAAFYDDIPNGTRSIFYQSSAPTGYTQVTSVNDRVLRVVSGSGGGSGGSWTITGLTSEEHILTVDEMPAHSHTGSTGNDSHSHSGTTGSDSHSHSISGGSHSHSFDFRDSAGGNSSTAFLSVEGSNPLTTGSDVGPSTATSSVRSSGHGHSVGSDSHSHSFSTGSDTHNHSVSVSNTGGGLGHAHDLTQDGTWRPSHIDVIIAERQK